MTRQSKGRVERLKKTERALRAKAMDVAVSIHCHGAPVERLLSDAAQIAKYLSAEV